MRQLIRDRVGIGWRPELAAGILSHLDEIDVVEVLLEDYLGASRRKLQALRFLSEQVAVTYHGVTLGLASAYPVDQRRLDRVARLVDTLQVQNWSEHLAFVRADGIEIGHLAAAPRTSETIDGTLRNLERLRQVVGIMPALENIATLLEPPASMLSEPEWIGAIATAASAELLIDLHNLLCNAHNAGFEPQQYLLRFPLQHATQVHLSGGRWISEPLLTPGNAGAMRLLDDHLHSVPAQVYSLLSLLATRSNQPLTVVIERDGNYPSFSNLMGEVRVARATLNHARSSGIEEVLNECA